MLKGIDFIYGPASNDVFPLKDLICCKLKLALPFRSKLLENCLSTEVKVKNFPILSGFLMKHLLHILLMRGLIFQTLTADLAIMTNGGHLDRDMFCLHHG